MNLAKLFKLPKKLGDSLLISLINNMVDYLRTYDSAIKVDDDGYIHLSADRLYLETTHDDDFNIYTVKNLYIGTREGSDFTISSDNMLSLYADNSISIQSDDIINLISHGSMNLNTSDYNDINLTSDAAIVLNSNNDYNISLNSDDEIYLSGKNDITLSSNYNINLYSNNGYDINLNSAGSINLHSDGCSIQLDSDANIRFTNSKSKLILWNDSDGLQYKQDDVTFFQINGDGSIYFTDDDGNTQRLQEYWYSPSEESFKLTCLDNGDQNGITFTTRVTRNSTDENSNYYETEYSVIIDNYNPWCIVTAHANSSSAKIEVISKDGKEDITKINTENYKYITVFIPNMKNVDEIKVTSDFCYTADTLITLADGTTKQVKDITYDDELKVWNFDEGKDDVAKPLWIKRTEYAKSYQLVTLSDGNTIKLCGSDGRYHCMFDVTEQKFNHAVDCIGHEVYTENGIATVVSIEEVKEKVDHYNIVTNYHMNLYANHILTSTEKNNIYPIADMKFVKDDRKIVPYEEFEKAHISREYYDGWRAGEWNEPLKDVITHLRRRKMYAKPQKRVKNGLRTDYFG